MKTRRIFNVFFVSVFMIGVVLVSCKKDKDKDEDPKQIVDPNNFRGDITGEVKLDSTKVYKLTGMVKVKNGAKLIIPAGTRIEGIGGTSAAIVVEQGGKIFVNGTAQKPVVMTSGLSTKSRGDWGGLVICGKAPCNSGGGMSEVGDVPYGGNDPDDNSGVIRYLRIEYAGAAFNSEKEYNGLSLFGVGKGTIIEYVQIHECADDGIEFYGGTVDAKYIVVTNVEDDMLDWTEGWTGKVDYFYGVQLGGFGNRGIEGDNWEINNNAEPYSNPTITNITLIGSGDQGNEPQGIELRRGTKAQISNVVLKNWKIGIRVSGEVSQNWTTTGDLKVHNVRFIDCITNLSVGNGSASAITESSTATGAGNVDAKPSWAEGWTVGF